MPEQSENNDGRQGSGHARSTSNSTNQRPNTQQSTNRMRVGSATYYDIASALLGKGCTDDLEEVFLSAARDGDFDRIENFIQRRTDVLVNIDVKDKRTGNTALIWAAKRGHTKIVQLLLKHGADITLRNYEGQTAVEIASPAIKTILLDSVERTTESSHRLLLQAAWQGNIKILRKLLTDNKVLDINCQNAEGLTPLLLATRDILQFERLSTQLNKPYNPVEVVTELLSNRGDIHAIDEDGKTCLHYASQSKATIAQSVVQVLITGGPNLETRDKRCFTAIHCASQTGNVHCLEVLLDGGTDVNVRGFAGTTPLHITAYNDHEKAANCLLKHGADITLTDDRGLTALDLARGKKMKSKLKEAWSDATKGRPPPADLAPIRSISREGSRASLDGTRGSRASLDGTRGKNKKGGDVIFEGLPENPFENMKTTPPKGQPVSRHLSLKEKADKAEEMMMKDIENGNFTPGPYMNLRNSDTSKQLIRKSLCRDGVRRLGLVRSQKPTPLPKSISGSHERLPSISPDRLSTDRMSDSPVPFSRNSRYRRSLDEAKMTYAKASSNPKLATFPNYSNSKKKKSSPMSTQMSTPDDLESVLQNSRITPSSPTPSVSRNTKQHKRSRSDTLASPSVGEIAASCDSYLPNKGRLVNPLSRSEDYSNYSSPRITPRRTPLEREITECSLSNYVCDRNYNNKTNSSYGVLNLDRMGLINKCQTPIQGVPLCPTSSKVLPPTPTFITQKALTCVDSYVIEEMSEKDINSSKEPSPRSDEENIKIAFGSSTELLRSRSILKEEFILEESRPKDFFLAQSSSSEDSARSKLSSRGSDSPKENSNLVTKQQDSKSSIDRQQTKNNSNTVKKQQISKSTVANQQSKNNEIVPKATAGSGKAREKSESFNTQTVKSGSLRVIARQNAAKPASKSANQSEKGKITLATKDKVTVHASEALEEVKDKNSSTEQKNRMDKKSSADVNQVKVYSASKLNVGTMNPNSDKGNKLQNSESSKTGMQVVSTKLLSNVKEEIRKAKEEQTSQNLKKENGSATLQSSCDVKNEEAKAKEISVTNNTSKASLQNSGNKVLCKSDGNLPSGSVNVANVNSDMSAKASVRYSSTKENIPRNSSTSSVRSSQASGGQIRNPINSAESPRKSSSGTNYRSSRGSRSNSADREGSNVVFKSTSATSGTRSEAVNLRSSRGNRSSSTDRESSGSVLKSASVTSRSKPLESASSRLSANQNAITKSTTSNQNSSQQIHKSPSDSNISKTSSAGMRKSQSEKMLSDNTSAVVSSSSAGKRSSCDSGKKTNNNSDHGVKTAESLSSGKTRSQSLSTIEEQSKNKSQSDLKLSLKQDTSNDSKGMNFQYKPASAGKPPLVEICPSGTPRTPRTSNLDCVATPASVPMQTPVIINPFEDMVNPYDTEMYNNTSQAGKNVKGIPATAYGYVVEKPNLERSKTQTSVKSRNLKSAKKSSNKDVKPSSAGKTRQGGRRRGARSKESKTSDDGSQRPTSGKSNKRVRSGRKKKEKGGECALTKQASQSDVALISGIGWHVATTCIDKSDVVAVKTTNLDSSSSDEDLLDKDTPRNPNLLHVQIYDGDLPSSLSSPRFREVKQNSETKEKLPVMENDGYPPMNLDMTQVSLPITFELSKMLARENSNASLPSEFDRIFQNIKRQNSTEEDSVDEQSYTGSAEMDDATAEIHRQILMGKLTPIPESPSLKSSVFLNKTMEAIEMFDKNVKDETLDALLGIKGEDILSSPKVDLNKPKGAKTSSNIESQVVTENSARTRQNKVSQPQSSSSSASSQKTNDRNGSSKDKTRSASLKGDSSASRTRRTNGSLKDSVSAKSKSLNKTDSIKDDIKNDKVDSASFKYRKSKMDSKDKVIIGKNNLTDNSKNSKGKIVKGISENDILLSETPRTSVLDKTSGSNELKFSIDLEKLDRDSEMKSTRRERKFSESKSDHEKEEGENIDEVIEEILSGAYPSNSTLRTNHSSKPHSLNSTLTDADKHLLLQLQNNNSPFHAKYASTPDKLQPEFVEDVTQNPTNPDLLKVFHADNFQIGQKMKAMIDAGADPEKVQAMVEMDNEARQIAKIMNSFRNMELYTGPGSVKAPVRESFPKPERSSAEPSVNRKPPPGGQIRPGSASGRIRLGKFTEIKKEKMTPRQDDLRQSTQKGDRHVKKSNQYHHSTSATVNDVTEEEIAAALRASTPENETIFSHIGTSQYDTCESRAGSACTTLSSQSSIEETIQWKKGNVLGKGAFGTVWCGLTSEGQLIAVKQIELNTANKDKAKKEYEKVQEEVELLKTLDHKNIVGYLGTSLEDSIVSIFMQFVPGGSIASILARFGALDEAVFRRYTRQILEGVEYLHANDVIHRDIKGGNVMLMPNGIIKLIDFGCAKRLCINLSMGQSQILKSMKGTPYWMAPEVVSETGHGKKSDIWSVGCTVFEMATRKPPWAEMNPMAAIFAIGRADKPVPQLPEKFSQEARNFVNACLTKDQSKRLTATELLQNVFIAKKKNKR